MEEKILNIMKSVFGVDNIDVTVSQDNCEQWDSLAQLNLVVELEDAFGITFEPEEIGEMNSFSVILVFVKKKLSIV